VNGTLIPLDGSSEPLQRAVEQLLETPSMLDHFRDPARATLLDYETQARALRATLARVVAEHRAPCMKGEALAQ
jgi:hypothetical protein